MIPYLLTSDPNVVHELHRKLWRGLDGHLLWAFNPNYPARRPRSR